MASPDEPMRAALRLAAKGRWTVSPNPRVGAVVMRRGRLVGQGFHRRAGEAHAEVIALAQAGKRARGGSLWVNLEPCSHQGRTGPCTQALLDAGVARVVVSHLDPDPRVSGKGRARLEAAGVAVEVGVLAREALLLNLDYLVAATLGRPCVTLKWAMSLDGRIATAARESQWITGRRARRWSLELREELDAVLVGSGTVLADDPRLDRRLGKAGRPNTRVVLDRRLRTRPGARLFEVEGSVLVYTESVESARRRALENRGATVVRMRRVTPEAVLRDLFDRDVRSLLVEGGAQVLGAFAAAGCYDRVAAAMAPLLIGGSRAPGPLAAPVAADLASSPRLETVKVGRRGGDLVWTGVREGCLQDLSSKLADS